MTFNSLNYFLFLPVVYLIFYLVGDRFRWCVLLAASLLFYAALEATHLLVVLALVAVNSYSFAIWLERAAASRVRLSLLWAGSAVNVLILLLMKYLPFLWQYRSLPEAALQPEGGWITIGVSYYVFQALSYLIDVYLQIQKPERHFGYFALYLAFFPKLLQGPIERGADLIPQLRRSYGFSYDNIRSGMLLFACGLFKKVVVADRLGLFVDAVYGDVHAFDGLPLLLATYAYAFQIYLDFSGYTDMALGSALLFNIHLTRNFDRPYSATSVAEFWRRWHITFSRWILDYIFKPLQMQWRNWKSWGSAAALAVTFLVSGIWHGASWGFVIWGGLHGLCMACSVFYKPYQKMIHRALGVENSRLQRAWRIFCTFNLVSLAWVFFRARSLDDAWYVVTNMLDLPASYAACQVLGWRNYLKSDLFMGLGAREFATALFFLGLLFVLRNRERDALFGCNALTRWGAYYAIVVTTWFFHVANDQFLYFQF